MIPPKSPMDHLVLPNSRILMGDDKPTDFSGYPPIGWSQSEGASGSWLISRPAMDFDIILQYIR